MESGFPTNQAPSFASTNVGSDIVFAHREFVQDIKSSVEFRRNSFILNPGNPVLCPWLSQIAKLYEEYEILGAVFEFKSTSATAVGTTSSAMGAVVMATDYDCEDVNFVNKRAMEAAEYATSGQPFQSFIHPIECDPKRNVISKMYVLPGVSDKLDAPGDPRFSIHGVTTIATVGQQLDDTIIGELWISYHIRLSRPILEVPDSTPNYTQHIGGVVTPTASGVFTQVINDSSGGSLTFSTSGLGPTLKGTLTCTNEDMANVPIMLTARSTHAGDSPFYILTSTPVTIFGTTTLLPVTTSQTGTPNYYDLPTRASEPDRLTCAFSCDMINVAFKFGHVGDSLTYVIPVCQYGGAGAGHDLYLMKYAPTFTTTLKKKTEPTAREFNAMLERLNRIERGESAAAAAAIAVTQEPATPDASDDGEFVAGGAAAAASSTTPGAQVSTKPTRTIADIEDLAKYRVTKR